MKRPLILACLLSTFACSAVSAQEQLPVVDTTAETSTDSTPAPLEAVEPVVEPIVAPPAEVLEKVYPGMTVDLAPVFNAEPVEDDFLSQPKASVKLAFLLPAKGSALEQYSDTALKGFLAANYALSEPHDVLLIRAENNATIIDQVQRAAAEGASIAVGSLDRAGVELLAEQEFLPLPVITLNEVDLYRDIAFTPEEIALVQQQKADALAEQKAQEEFVTLFPSVFPELVSAFEADVSTADTVPDSVRIGMKTDEASVQANLEALALVEPVQERFQARIAAKTSVPGLILAEDVPEQFVHQEPRVFPRGLLMMSLSMENDARYIARLAVESLPHHTETGERPKVLLIDQDAPLEKRIANAYMQELVASGHTPDVLTVNVKDMRHLSKFFDLIVEQPEPEPAAEGEVPEGEEPLIDKETDPVAWRQQQLRLNKTLAEQRAAAALAEPPYHTVLLALNAKTASLIRSRLPIRTRVWGAPIVYPGNPETDTQAKSMTYDLRHVSFVESPFILNFDVEKFEETYRVPAPTDTLSQRLFSLGVDALSVARLVSHGHSHGQTKGLTGRLSFDLNVSPVVARQGQTAMIFGGQVKPMSERAAKRFQLVKPGTDPLAKFRKVQEQTEQPAAPSAATESSATAP